MDRNPLHGERIIRGRISLGSKGEARSWRRLPGEQLGGHELTCGAWSFGMGRRPDVMLPGHHVALGIQPAAQLCYHRRGFRFPDELLLAAPLHPHRPPNCLRQDDRVGCHVVGAVLPVAACSLYVDQMHIVYGQVEQLCQCAAQGIGSLGARPDRDVISLHFRHGAGRPNGGMCMIGLVVRSMYLLRGSGKCLLQISLFHQDVVFGRLLPQCCI